MAVGRDYSDAARVRGHVVFAAPPATTTRDDAPVIEVPIARVHSPTDRLGSRPVARPSRARMRRPPALQAQPEMRYVIVSVRHPGMAVDVCISPRQLL